MKLSNAFTIARPVEEVYDAFLDIERIATCMPGSRLLGQQEPGTYEGEVRVKVGPLGVAYTGHFTILEEDREQHQLRMRAKGREQRGAGNADAHIVATLNQNGTGTVVNIDTELDIRGKVAQFGRGVIGEVTDGIMQNFAQNVEQMLTGEPATAGLTPGQTTEDSTGPASSRPVQVSEPAAHAQTTGAQSAAQVSELDAWRLVIRPMLQRHAGSIATVAFSGVAAYFGARAGARAGSRRN